jgi:hypothetical protein
MWHIETTDTFDTWLDDLDDTDRANVLASMIVLRERGPMLPRPYADTVKGSAFNNMKELRVTTTLKNTAKATRYVLSLPLIQNDKAYFCVQATKPVMKSDFMT